MPIPWIETRRTIKLSDIAVELFLNHEEEPFYHEREFERTIAPCEDEDRISLHNEQFKFIHIPTGIYAVQHNLNDALCVLAIKLERRTTTEVEQHRQLKV